MTRPSTSQGVEEALLLKVGNVIARARRYHLFPAHHFTSRYLGLFREDLKAVYARNLRKWLLVAPLIGVMTGLLATGVVVIILNYLWPAVLGYYLAHHWAIVPGLVLGCGVAGLIMQYLTPDPDQHSTEEIIRSYHEHEGDIDMRPFVPKLAAAVATVGMGGSAALEGPGIYGGGALGSWLWTKLHMDSRDRRIMLICGAAAGMSAVFRAPLTGIAFALEMPYRDDLAHEALVPALISSVVAFVTLSVFLGAQPLFNFIGGSSYTRFDIYWSALLGLIIGLVATAFVVTFRRVRTFFVHWAVPHWSKLALGGLLTGICGYIFLFVYNGTLVPLGPNYEAVGQILTGHHSSAELVVFAVMKMAATTFTLGSGGVSAMFVPLFLSGGALGTAFAQSVVHSPMDGLYAAVGMASFIAAGYKAPLAAVVFIAEATGGHAFVVPALIGAAVAYAVSGDASASGDQHLHEAVRVQELGDVTVSEVMQTQILSAQASLTLAEFSRLISPHTRRAVFAVFEGKKLVGTIALWSMARVPPEKWTTMHVRDLMDDGAMQVEPACDVMEVLRMLQNERNEPLVVVVSGNGRAEGVVTKADVLHALEMRGGDYQAQTRIREENYSLAK